SNAAEASSVLEGGFMPAKADTCSSITSLLRASYSARLASACFSAGPTLTPPGWTIRDDRRERRRLCVLTVIILASLCAGLRIALCESLRNDARDRARVPL